MLNIVEGLGYRIENIEAELGPERFKKFQKWFNGQTGAVASDGRLLIYPHDYKAFLEGSPVYD